jgi:hypothetical protein
MTASAIGMLVFGALFLWGGLVASVLNYQRASRGERKG